MRSFQGLSLLASVASVAFAQTTTTTPAGTTPSASCPAYSCAGGAQATVANNLSGYAPASSFCSSSYVRPQTCNALGPASTVRTTVATVTTQAIVQTQTVTVTGTTRTFTSTVSTTPSTTITVTSSVTQGTSTTSTVIVPETTLVNQNKRQATTRSTNKALPTIAPTSTTSIDRQSSILSSLRASQSSAYIAAVCTCLVKPSSTTVTSTPAVTSSVTSTVTQRVALQARTTFYPSTTITVTVTGARVTRTISTAVTTAFTSVTTTTTTQTATATAANLNACALSTDGTDPFNGECGPGAMTPDGQCACFPDTANPARGFCANFFGDCGQQCQLNSDCPAGLDCLASSGCTDADDNPINTCATPADVTTCATTMQKRSSNPMAFKAIARRGQKQRHSEGARFRPGIDDQ